MRFEQLTYLEAAIRTGSFRQAAKELGVSQPTITNQVQRLEEDLGVILVTRGAQGVRPTFAAERILPHVLNAIRAERMLRQETDAFDGLKIGSVRLATVAVGAMVVLPNIVKRLHKEHPNIRFEITEGSTDMVRNGVISGHFDMGILTRLELPEDEADSDRLYNMDLMTGRLVLCVPATHPLAEIETFDIAQLNGAPLVFYGKGSVLRRAFEHLIEGIEANVVYTTRGGGAETAMSMVRAGVGIAIGNTLAPSTASGDGIVLVPIQEPWARTTLSAVVRAGEIRSPVVQTLLRLLSEDASGHPDQRR